MPPFNFNPNSGNDFGLGQSKSKSQAQIDCEAKGGTWDEQTKTCKLPSTLNQGEGKNPIGFGKESPFQFGTNVPKDLEGTKQRREECIAKGGTWDNKTLTCKLPEIKKEEEVIEETPTATNIPGSVVQDSETGEIVGFINSTGDFVKAGREDTFNALQKIKEKTTVPEGAITTEQIGQAQQNIAEGQALAGQVGQFDPFGISPTGLDRGQALTAGLVGAIPSTIQFAAGAAAIGAKAGSAGGAGGIALGAAGGFVAGLASSMIGDFKAQRRDTTTAQQRVLDEGKQVLQDLASDAAADPTNNAQYLADFNLVLGQIDAAYRQMKLDTSRDVTKFETAIPNLAEFETFYADSGEKDVLVNRMKLALTNPQPTEYNIIEQTLRRGS